MSVSAAEHLAYEILFCKGISSDVNLNINGQTYELHKELLTQAPYFENLFKESINLAEPFIIDIPGTEVNNAGVRTVLALLYLRSYPIELSEVCSILAVAKFFGMGFVQGMCEEKIVNALIAENVCNWLDISFRLGLKNVEDHCKKFLKWNFTESVASNTNILKTISIDVMKYIISLNYLYVHLEMVLYNILKQWMFLKLSDWNGEPENVENATKEFYKQQNLSGGVVFLETNDGIAFEPVFRLVRLQHCIQFLNGLDLLRNDRIIPKCWITNIVSQNYRTIVKTVDGEDNGPGNDFAHDEFEKLSMRCGIELKIPNLSWQWNISGDVIQIRCYSVHRHILIQWKTEQNTHIRRRIMYRIAIATKIENTIEEKRFRPICCATFKANQKLRVLRIDKGVNFPIFLSFNLLTTVPYDKKFFLDESYSMKFQHSRNMYPFKTLL